MPEGEKTLGVPVVIGGDNLPSLPARLAVSDERGVKYGTFDGPDCIF